MVADGVFTDKDVLKLASEGMKIVDPFEESFVQPSSIDIRLGNTIIEYNISEYVLGDEIDEEKIAKNIFEEYPLDPGKSAIVGLHEKINIPHNAMGLVMPRSSITRLGITIIPTYMNPGYTGQMPITIINNSGNRIILRPMLRVVQLILVNLSDIPGKRYGEAQDTKYFEETVLHSQLHMDKEINTVLTKIMETESPNLYKRIREDENG